jgi:acyl dehydratase
MGLVKSRTEAVNQNGETVLSFEAWGMFGRRPG